MKSLKHLVNAKPAIKDSPTKVDSLPIGTSITRNQIISTAIDQLMTGLNAPINTPIKESEFTSYLAKATSEFNLEQTSLVNTQKTESYLIKKEGMPTYCMNKTDVELCNYSSYDLSAGESLENAVMYLHDLWVDMINIKIKGVSETHYSYYNGMYIHNTTYALRAYLDSNTDLEALIDTFMEGLYKDTKGHDLVLRRQAELSHRVDEEGRCYWDISCRLGKIPNPTIETKEEKW